MPKNIIQILIYIFSDGCVDEATAVEVKATRSYLHSVKGFREITIVERDTNWGLASNIRNLLRHAVCYVTTS